MPEIDNDGVLTGNSADLTNYTCSYTVDTVTGTVTTKNIAGTEFLVQLTSTDTAALEAGGYRVGIEVRDDTQTPPYVSEIHKQIKIAAQLVT